MNITRRSLFQLVGTVCLGAAGATGATVATVRNAAKLRRKRPEPPPDEEPGRWYRIAFISRHLVSQHAPDIRSQWFQFDKGRRTTWIPAGWKFDAVRGRVWIPVVDAPQLTWQFFLWPTGRIYKVTLSRLPSDTDFDGWSAFSGYGGNPLHFRDACWRGVDVRSGLVLTCSQDGHFPQSSWCSGPPSIRPEHWQSPWRPGNSGCRNIIRPGEL